MGPFTKGEFIFFLLVAPLGYGAFGVCIYMAWKLWV